MGDLSQLDLFSIKSDLIIFKIKKSDITQETDRLKTFKRLVSEHEEMYPDIERWLKTKVFPGIKTGERTAYLGLNNDKPIVSAVVKKGERSKFCHLHINDKFQNQNIGDLFFAMMALDVRNSAKETHFTLPESLWVKKESFFQSFGFTKAVKSRKQYRVFEEELICSVSFNTLWEKTLEKLPIIISSFTRSNINITDGLLMSIKPKYLEKLQNGNKVVEIRKKFNSKWRGCKVALYSSSPSKAILGYATIDKVEKGFPNEIWEKYQNGIGCTREEFNNYTKTSKQVYAIPLKTFETYLAPLYLEQISMLLKKDLNPPQSYLTLKNNKPWAEAVLIAELLHGQFQLYSSIMGEIVE
jgi:predicted transcriptional regulator